MLDIFKYTLGAKGWLKAWAIYLMSFPFYFFPAGSAQPSDIFIIIVIGAYISVKGFKMFRDNREVFNKFLRFCIYLTVINLGVFVALLGQRNSGLPWYFMSAFYYFNLVVMGLALALYRQYGTAFLRTTIYSCILAAILQIGLSYVLSTNAEGVRGSMFFTNPNQLGYYSLCGLAIVLVLETMLKIPKLIVYLSFFLFGYLAVVSVSKAALGALIILVGVYLLANGIVSLKNVLAIAVVGGIGYFAFLNTQFGQNFQRSLEVRQLNDEDRPDEITEWEYRGYDRISNHPGYLILGAGEGGYNRFDTFIENHEMHSSIGTIVFCYGIPGTALFILFVLSLVKRLPWYYVIYALPLFAYGVTHMGLRFTIFWIALIMFPIMRVEIQKRKYLSNKRRLEAAKSNHRTALSQIPTQGAA